MTEALQAFQRENRMAAHAERAFERRFGKSTLPLRQSFPRHGVVRIHDAKTGSWADYDISTHRVRRIAERQAGIDQPDRITSRRC